MKLKTPQLIGLVVILAIIGAALYFFTQNTSSPNGTENTNEGDSNVASSSDTGTLADILQFGSSTTCTYSSEQGEGTIYTTSDRLRGDFTASTGEAGHIIRDSEYTYVWGEGLQQGIRITNQEYSMDDIANNEQTDDVIDANQEIDYECSNWNVDQSVFEVPSNIEFMDITSQMEQIEQMGEQSETSEGQMSPCDTCDSLSGQAAEQCRAQFCN